MEYTDDLQKLLISYMISDSDLFVRTNQIIKPEYWNKRYRTTIEMLKEHYDEYRILPTLDQIKAETGNTYKNVDIKETVEQSQWFFDTLEKFCQHKAMELLVIEEGPELIKNNNLDLLVEKAKDNLLITLETNLGTEYFDDPLKRLERMKDRANMRSTGWKNIDKILYGGFERGTLNFFAGGPGCIIGSTKVKVKDNVYNTISDISIEKIYNNFQSGRYEVYSPDGYVPVLDCIQKNNKTLMTVTTKDIEITVSDDHLFQLTNGRWVYAKYLQLNDDILTNNISGVVNQLQTLETTEPVYDLSVDHPNHRYYTNDLCSHNTGKSLFMQNLCLNWVQQGLNVLYISLELSEDLVALRFDAMTVEKSTKEIMSNVEDTALELSLISKKHVGKDWGKIWIKKMPESSTTVNNIRAYIKEFEGQTGQKIDAIAVDYLDLLRPNNTKINLNELFIKDKYVSEELRAMAVEFNIYCISASQLGRSAAESEHFNVSHIAGGISKINTADNVLAIYTNPVMRDKGEYQIQFLKTRTAAGVGRFVIMQYNNMTMRITSAPDLSDDEENDIKTKAYQPEAQISNKKEIKDCDSIDILKKMTQMDSRVTKLSSMKRR